VIGGTPRSPEEHKRRVGVARDAAEKAEPGIADWVYETLNSSNDLRLRARLGQIIDDAGALGEDVRAASPDFCRLVTLTRNALTHRSKEPPLTGLAQRAHVDALGWVLRRALLRQVGFSEEVATALVRRNRDYQDCVWRLKASIAD